MLWVLPFGRLKIYTDSALVASTEGVGLLQFTYVMPNTI